MSGIAKTAGALVLLGAFLALLTLAEHMAGRAIVLGSLAILAAWCAWDRHRKGEHFDAAVMLAMIALALSILWKGAA